MSGADDAPKRREGSVPLAIEQHAKYVHSLDKAKHTFEYQATEHLRVSGIYWSLSAMCLLERQHEMDRDGIISFVASCQDPATGGFGGGPDHDPHVLYTLSALQILEMFSAPRDAVDRPAAARFVAGLQREDGSFVGDAWGETDTRFTYCAVQCALLLAGDADAGTAPKFMGPRDEARDGEVVDDAPWGRLLDRDRAVAHVLRCRNFDGAFGTSPGAESHAGQVFCCVGALAMLGALGGEGGCAGALLANGWGDLDVRVAEGVDGENLCWWLCERQLPCGGLNGRPGKKEDVCYSWWVLSSLRAMGRDHWIDGGALAGFILSCEDKDDGGFGDRPGDVSDVFHTFFALAGLSMLGKLGKGAPQIDPVTALPMTVARGVRGSEMWLRGVKDTI